MISGKFTEPGIYEDQGKIVPRGVRKGDRNTRGFGKIGQRRLQKRSHSDIPGSAEPVIERHANCLSINFNPTPYFP